jgi:hypothetical protein
MNSFSHAFTGSLHTDIAIFNSHEAFDYQEHKLSLIRDRYHFPASLL